MRAFRSSFCRSTLTALLLVLPAATRVEAGAAAADEAVHVDVPLHGHRFATVAGIGEAIAVEDGVCAVDITPEGIRLTGLAPGQTVVQAWVGARRVELLVRVALPPLSAAIPEDIGRMDLTFRYPSRFARYAAAGLPGVQSRAGLAQRRLGTLYRGGFGFRPVGGATFPGDQVSALLAAATASPAVVSHLQELSSVGLLIRASMSHPFSVFAGLVGSSVPGLSERLNPSVDVSPAQTPLAVARASRRSAAVGTAVQVSVEEAEVAPDELLLVGVLDTFAVGSNGAPDDLAEADGLSPVGPEGLAAGRAADTGVVASTSSRPEASAAAPVVSPTANGVEAVPAAAAEQPIASRVESRPVVPVPPTEGEGQAGARVQVVRASAAQEEAVRLEVPLNEHRFAALEGISQAIVVDDAICSVDITPDGIRVTGRRRGQTAVLVWVGDRRVELLVRVALPTPTPGRLAAAPPLGPLGQGRVGTSAQMAVDPGGTRNYYFQHDFDWSQQVDGRRVRLRGQASDATAPGVPMNVGAVSFEYARPDLVVTVLDFSLNLAAGPDGPNTGYSPFSAYVFRGANVRLTRGRTGVELFGGTTQPSYYRSLGSTSAIGGMTLRHRHSDRLYLYTTAAFLGLAQGAENARRETDAFQSAGFVYRPDARWMVQVTQGASRQGHYGDGVVTFTGDRVSGLLAATTTSPDFALNRLRLLSTNGSSVRGSLSARSSVVAASVSYERSNTRSSPRFPAFGGMAEYFNPHVSLRVARAHSLFANGVYSRHQRSLASGGDSLVKTMALGWTSRWSAAVSNTMQVTVNDVEGGPDERLQVGVRNAVTVRVKGVDLGVGVQHNQHDPSLTTRLRQQIALLPAEDQLAFITDPNGFVGSGRLSPALRENLAAVRAADTQVSLSAQFRLGSKVNVSASYGLLRNTAASDVRSETTALGYTVVYQATPGLQVHSSLSEALVFDSRRQDLARSTVFQVGITKSFSGGPNLVGPSARNRRIEGRVFVDRDVSGTPDPLEAGLGGLEVTLDSGERAVTDATGRFVFTGLTPRPYRVNLAVGQFEAPVRLTSVSNVRVDLTDLGHADVHFGVVNFARVSGSVFNDYTNTGRPHADAQRLGKVTLRLFDAAGSERRVETDGTGHYRIDDLVPGAYRLEVAPTTLPDGYVGPNDPIMFEVRPIRTVVIDVPIRALRSVAGHVFLSRQGSTQDGPDDLRPLSGVTVSAGAVTGTTAADGSFLLRDLPAGDVVVTLVPQQPLPPDLSAPVGTLRMPAGPIQVNQTTIVLSSEDLARYFQSDAGQSACPVADATAAPGLTGGGASSPGTGPCFQSTAAAPAGR